MSEEFETLVVTGMLAAPGDTGTFAGAFECPDAFVGSLERPEPLVESICCADALDEASTAEGGSKFALLWAKAAAFCSALSAAAATRFASGNSGGSCRWHWSALASMYARHTGA